MRRQKLLFERRYAFNIGLHMRLGLSLRNEHMVGSVVVLKRGRLLTNQFLWPARWSSAN